MAKEQKSYSVYMHIAPNNKKYIGITYSQPVTKRWGKNGYNYRTQRKFYRAITKYGWDNFSHVILYTNLSLEQAYTKERQLIEEYDTVKNGYNSDFGGAGAEGHTVSEEARRKMSERAKNRPPSRTGISIPQRKVYLYDIDGTLLLETEGYTEMAENLKCPRSTVINDCNNGKLYKGKYIIVNDLNITLLSGRIQLAKQKQQLDKQSKIFQFDLEGNLINSFVLYREASAATGIPIGSIGKVCSGIDLMVHNFIFLKTNDAKAVKERIAAINSNQRYKYGIPYRNKKIREEKK